MQKEEIEQSFSSPNVIKSASFDQTEILTNIIKLYCPEGIELDPTYSKGNFYNGLIKQPSLKYDIRPQTPDTNYGDCRNLPFKEGTIRSECIDPPFLNTEPIHETEDNDLMHKRFSYINGTEALFQFYRDSIKEAYRILAPKGILIFKCQDMVSSGKQYLTHVEVINYASKIGFYPIDLFVLLNRTRMISGKHSNQKHARKYHSYFIVLQKIKSPISYESTSKQKPYIYTPTPTFDQC